MKELTPLRALAPWTGLMGLRREMDRLFDRLWLSPWDELEGPAEWMPSLDLAEKKDTLVVSIETPGVDPHDIEISLHGDLLLIKGEKSHEKEEKDERWHRVERSYGAFSRTVRLPAPVDASKVTAAFKNGLLTITLPKTAAAKGTTIPVKAE